MVFCILMRLWMDNSTVISVCMYLWGEWRGERREGGKAGEAILARRYSFRNNQPYRLLSIPSCHFPPTLLKIPST